MKRLSCDQRIGLNYLKMIAFMSLSVLISMTTYAQTATADKPAPSDTTLKAEVIRPIPLSRIAEETDATNQRLLKVKPALENKIARSQGDSLLLVNEKYLADLKTEIHFDSLGKYREGQLMEFQKMLINLKSKLSQMKNQLASYQSVLNTDATTISRDSRRWKVTIDSADYNGISAELRKSIRNNLAQINDYLGLNAYQKDLVKTKMEKVSAQLIQSDNYLQLVSQELVAYQQRLFIRTAPAFHDLILRPRDSVSFTGEFSKIFKSQILDQKNFIKENKKKLMGYLFLFIGLSVLLFLLGILGRNRTYLKDDPEMKKVMVVLNRPLLSSEVLTLFTMFFFIMGAPGMVNNLIFMVLIFPILFLIPRLFPQIKPGIVYGYAVIFTISRLERVFTRYYILDSIFVALLALGIIIFMIYILKNRKIFWPGMTREDRPLTYYLTWVALVYFIIVLVSDYMGYKKLASFLNTSLIATFNLFVFTFITYTITVRILYFILNLPLLKKLNVIRNYQENILAWFTRVLRLVAVFFWLVTSMKLYRVKGPIFSWLQDAFTRKWIFGELSLSLWDVILFFLVIGISVWLSRIIRILLQDELLERMSLRKGVPQAVSMMIRVTLITLGLMIALSMIGIKPDKITIVIGALGVGIGFGLQDIIRNLISGIIIIFERPINVGDTIQLSSLNLFGTVSSIGIRSSIVKSFDGAEVIIPNGNLIASEMINWTHSDNLRRQEIRIGVAYDTDLQKAMEIMEKAMAVNEKVLKTPPAQIVFEGFGNSSIDFRLLFWTYFDQGFPVKTSVAVDISRLFKDEGIVIPFPQQDLYIKSVAESKEQAPIPKKIPAKNDNNIKEK